VKDFQFVQSPSGHNTEPRRFDILKAAISYYSARIRALQLLTSPDKPACKVGECKLIPKQFEILQSFETPEVESYTLKFDDSSCTIECTHIYGCMHGMKTFTQMMDPLQGNRIPESFSITDKPSFTHRGLLIDTSRRFLEPTIIKEIIELMASVKMNVLHWHIVDDHSFPLELSGFEELAKKGAYSRRAVYTEKDVKEILNYARQFGIIVMPEIDIPGHTISWFKSHPDLQGLAKDAIDPTSDESYKFIEKILSSIKDLFETTVIHLGGDESKDSWDTDGIKQWMMEKGVDKAGLFLHWLKHMNEIAVNIGITKIWMWEDFLSVIPLETLAKHQSEVSIINWQTWEADIGRSAEFGKSLNRQIIFSKDFYLDHLKLQWDDLYKVPMYTVAPAGEKKPMATTPGGNVVGGEACMWGEWVDNSNIISRIWPRAAAVAENLWSAPQKPDSGDAVMRLAKWRCREKEIFLHERIETVGQVRVNNPKTEWIWHTDRSQWYCDEADLVAQTAVAHERHEVPISFHKN